MTVLLNIFDVQPEDENTFYQAWEVATGYFAAAPGFQGVKLHKEVRLRRRMTEGQHYHDPDSLAPEAKTSLIRFFNYVEWQSPEAFELFTSTGEYRKAVQGLAVVANRMAQLFEVVRERGPVEEASKH